LQQSRGRAVRLLVEAVGDARKGKPPLVEHDVEKSDVFGGQRVKALLRSERAAKLIRLFFSARRRPTLTADEVLIFLAIGYLSVSMTGGDMIVIRPISLIEVAQLLGIPKETVRRKTTRLIDIEYVGSTPKGIVLKKLGDWCKMLEAVD
jgi:hypothetical protein